ncbi:MULTISPECIES: carbohydrate ABC transporter permease [Paenibacillus]|uniref:ABC transporter permease n=2 Tax=Paenibacillus TaxID=44249 RepID=A0A081P2Y0_9BACL|nr:MULTISPECIES: carbohydrate ABC transporter permease [Paenibacillus]KEQ25053.1 ABC transporter permease [Paenibacillus tyrfis]KPV56219.1 ABC transporter permease [Paenibacillus sp. A3]KZE81950.1 ABC transporter permease [Paenibacillus elgii]MCP1311199.1 carbohydrate ABC transporter permease [Paenibacillus tyrfis]NEN85853.1 carbohydrate ABC transporter permease [Paenibacillus elgii]
MGLRLRRISVFDAVNMLLLLVLCLAVVIPFWYMLTVSLSPVSESLGGRFYLIPEQLNFEAYRYLFSTDRFVRSIGNTVYITVVGTAVNLLVSITLAYALSKKTLPGRKLMLLMMLFTMVFSGGLIPKYLLIKSIGLLDSYWALILPGATNAFTVLVMKTFFQSLPESLDEAARIDGAGEPRILLSVVIPLSMPIIATFSLFFMVGHWNEFFGAIIYLSDNAKWPIQVLLRLMVIAGEANIASENNLDFELASKVGDNVKMAAIIVAMIPIVVVYPFLQKHFAKGAMLGSIKE